MKFKIVYPPSSGVHISAGNVVVEAESEDDAATKASSFWLEVMPNETELQLNEKEPSRDVTPATKPRRKLNVRTS